MHRIICALILGFASIVATAAKPLALADQAPDRYEVKRGDTLWSISGHFLKEPWRWPEIWRLNREQISNPHRIYPGDVVILDRSGEQPRLSLQRRFQPRAHSEPLPEALPTANMVAIRPFLSRPVISPDAAVGKGAEIVATEENRVLLGPGQRAFASGVGGEAARWTAYRRGEALKDPVSGEILGYHTVPVGTLKLLQGGQPAVLEVLEAREELGRGNRLAPETLEEPFTMAPHAPGQPLNGSVIPIPGAARHAGPKSVVAINRGTRDGAEPGHVLALARQGQAIRTRDGNPELRAPDERYGTVLVFRCFERVSYALVLDATRQVDAGDRVETP